MKSSFDRGNRSGSALLVVLGFLSFMVVSAVAFAIYMRAERLPSSALRRNVATRHLVKAALAHAMSRVDDAIRADPFPGIVNTNGGSTANYYHDNNGNNPMDIWYGRVFMPPDPEGTTRWRENQVNGIDPTQFAPITETVSVLTLEALGYIPPPLVNDVRFLSRSTWTAKWQNFAFDAGRFAFCAVNVSDFFDINRVSADIRSAAPNSRISLAHLLRPIPDQGVFNVDGIDEKTDTDIQKKVGDLSDITESALSSFNRLFGPNATSRRTYSNQDANGGSVPSSVPYISMLDYNLALGSEGGDFGINTIIRSCFFWWIEGKGTRDYFFFNGATDLSDGVKSALRQPFVTDSWATNETYKVADFSKLEGQPFRDLDMGNEDATIDDVMRSKAEFNSQKGMLDGNGPFGMLGGNAKVRLLCSLYDYLDHDSIPLSLVAPSVESIPMVAAIEPIVKSRLKFTQKPPVKDPQTPPRDGVQTTTTTWTLDPDSLSRPSVRILVAYPFRHARRRNNRNFYAQVVMKVFVAAGNVPLYPQGDLAELKPKEKADWSAESKAPLPNGAFVWSFCSTPKEITLPASMENQEDALIELPSPSWNGDASVPPDLAVYSTIETEKFKEGVSQGDKETKYRFDLRPFKDGALLPEGDQADVSAFLTDEYRAYVAIWVRVTDSGGTVTYDLAPAIASDDEKLNDVTGERQKLYAKSYCGNNFVENVSCSFLKFSTPEGPYYYTYADLSQASGTPFDWAPKSLAVADPRYNYLPEDWYRWDQSGINGSGWVDAISTGDGFLNQDDCDRDIFMFTSDQGYLQSLGEFAFLPNLGAEEVMAEADTAVTTHPDTPNNTKHKGYAWRTYIVDRSFYDDFARVGIGRSSSKDQTVNPYTDNAEILYAAFANTPCNYWVTGRSQAGMLDDLPEDMKEIVNKLGDTSTQYGNKIDTMSVSLHHAFCEKNEDSELQIKSKHLYRIARYISREIRNYKLNNEEYADMWKAAYDKVWNEELWNAGYLNASDDDTFKNFMGAKGEQKLDHPLYTVDRKFLYSYWRDCFANKQQLFLIFVRAESSALGGSGEGTPPQQGGRAVALVWRDPQSNMTDGESNDPSKDRDRQPDSAYDRRPHRMRVLFYHQFD